MLPTIVWDVDDVLNNLMCAWFHGAWLPAHPACAVTYSQLRANPPHEALGIAKAEYLASLDAFRAGEAARRLTPRPEILAWFASHGHFFRHLALTARPLASAGTAAEWVFTHFGNHIRCYGVVPSRLEPSAPLYDRDKADFLRWFGGVDLFVDDSEENVAAVETLGIDCILFPQPWNRASRTVEDTLALLAARLVTR